MTKRADHDRLSADRYRVTEPVNRRRVRGLQLSLLAPPPAAPHKSCPRPVKKPRRATIYRRADHDRLLADRHREAEPVTCRRVRSFQLLLLTPNSDTSPTHIRR